MKLDDGSENKAVLGPSFGVGLLEPVYTYYILLISYVYILTQPKSSL